MWEVYWGGRVQKWPLSESRKKRKSEERRCLLFIRGHSACKYGQCGDSVLAVITVSHLGCSWQCVLLLFSPWGQVVVNVWMLTVPTHKLRRILWLWIVMPSQNINSLSFLQYFPQTSTFIFIFFSHNSVLSKLKSSYRDPHWYSGLTYSWVPT